MKTTATPQRFDVCVGKSDTLVGQLAYAKQGQREFSTFIYDTQWLANRARFEVSPDLPLVAGFQVRRAAAKVDSNFHFAFADTAPDAWGRRVIARAHAKERQQDPKLAALTELDYLAAVDDFSRVGALRLRDSRGINVRTVDEGKRTTPTLIELELVYNASRAVEHAIETAEDLKYLLGKGTSLGGMRPKCSVIDERGRLAIGKFPSKNDERSVTRGEVLALRLAALAGIDTAKARIVNQNGTPFALIERFDRAGDFARIPYLSAASMLQASREEDHSYSEIADVIRARCVAPTADTRQLWRRMVFNLLITNVDDHLQNLGFLYVGNGQWRLAPAFDLNPFPEKDRESKTWLSTTTGPIDSLQMLLENANYFGLGAPGAAQEVLAEIVSAVSNWQAIAVTPDIGMSRQDLNDFAPAFEHESMQHAREALRTLL